MIGEQISDIELEKMNLLTTKRIKHGEIPYGNLVKIAVTLLGNGRILLTLNSETGQYTPLDVANWFVMPIR